MVVSSLRSICAIQSSGRVHVRKLCTESLNGGTPSVEKEYCQIGMSTAVPYSYKGRGILKVPFPEWK